MSTCYLNFLLNLYYSTCEGCSSFCGIITSVILLSLCKNIAIADEINSLDTFSIGHCYLGSVMNQYFTDAFHAFYWSMLATGGIQLGKIPSLKQTSYIFGHLNHITILKGFLLLDGKKVKIHLTGIKLGFWLIFKVCIIDFMRQAESSISGYSSCELKIQSPYYIIIVTQIELQPLYKLQLPSLAILHYK